tara:strand:- start:450 stop:851 length:402 start_codon:yes stop_codon:yes gene_type:complete
MSNKLKGDRRIAVSSVQIEVKNFKGSMKDLGDSLKKIEKGEDIRERRIVFDDLDTLRSILTKERMRLLHCIRIQKPDSIYELAKDLERNWRLVSKDVELLNNAGLVKLEKKIKPREAIKPTVNFEKMNIGIMI